MSFKTILTDIGLAKISNAIALGQTISLTQMAVGDGNGNPVEPTQDMTALVREVYRGALNRLDTDPDNPAYIIAEIVIPAADGGWTVHEVGVFDDEGDMLAVANFPATYKPVAAEGSTRDLVVRVYIEVTNTDTVELKIDPSVVLASRAWVADNYLSALGGTTDQLLRKASNADNDVEWFSPDADSLNVVMDAVTEPQTLAAGQTIVTLATVTTTGMALYVEGAREFDFTVDSETQFTLGTSYAEGTRIWMIQNDPNTSIMGSIVGKVSSMSALLAVGRHVDGQVVNLTSFHQGWTVSLRGPVGGGVFVYDALRAKSQHNGGTIVSPTVPWDGSEATLPGFLAGTGETDGAGAGCWVRLYEMVRPQYFGAKGDGAFDDTQPIQSALNVSGNIDKWALYPGGGGVTVWFDNGSYRTTDTLQVNNFSTSIVGPNTPRFSGCAEIWIDNTAKTSLIRIADGVSDFCASNIKLVGPQRLAGKFVIEDGWTEGEADRDYEFSNVTFSTAEYAVKCYGRGLHLYDCDYVLLNGGISLDWPINFVPGANADQSLESGFRSIIIEGGRCHGMTGHLVVNQGSNAVNLNNLKVSGVSSDTFVGVFKGSGKNLSFCDLNFLNGNGSQMYVFEDVEEISISGGCYAGLPSATQPTEWDIGNFIVLTAGKTASGITVDSVTVRDVGGHVIALNGSWSDINISDNIFSNVLFRNNDIDSAPEVYAVVSAFSGGNGLSFTDNIVKTGDYTRNGAIVSKRSITDSQITGWVVRGTIYNEDYINETDLNPYYDANRDVKTILYAGDGSASQVFTLSAPAKAAIVSCRSGANTGMVFSNAVGTGVVGTGLKVTGPTVEVSLDFNAVGNEYSLIIIR